MQPKTITVRDLREHLDSYDPECEVYFGNGDLSISRFKPRRDDETSMKKVTMVQIEFEEIYGGYLRPSG